MKFITSTMIKLLNRFWWVSVTIILVYTSLAYKQLYLLYAFSQPVENFWTALYFSPCGHYKDPVTVPLKLISDWNVSNAIKFLDCLIRAKCAQTRWESVSHLYRKLQYIDASGKVDSRTWLQLCEPLDSRLQAIFKRSLLERDANTKERKRYMAVNPQGLITGYENHQLLNEAEKWFALLEQREAELSGTDSHDVAAARLEHANFHVRHGQLSKAQAIVDLIANDFGDEWCIQFRKSGKTGRYCCVRKDGKNYVIFKE